MKIYLQFHFVLFKFHHCYIEQLFYLHSFYFNIIWIPGLIIIIVIYSSMRINDN
jgi:hypothetical protein